MVLLEVFVHRQVQVRKFWTFLEVKGRRCFIFRLKGGIVSPGRFGLGFVDMKGERFCGPRFNFLDSGLGCLTSFFFYANGVRPIRDP